MEKEGKILRLVIRGTGKTVEEAAVMLGVTRRMMYHYFKMDKLSDELKINVKDKLDLDIAQNENKLTASKKKTVNNPGDDHLFNKKIKRAYVENFTSIN